MNKNMLMTIGIVLGIIVVVSNSAGAVIQKTKLEVKHIEVIGDRKKEVIDTDHPVNISIIGSHNEVEIADEVDVRKVVLSGYANLIILPPNAKPEITKTGAKNEVKYREGKEVVQKQRQGEGEEEAAKIQEQPKEQEKAKQETAKIHEQPEESRAIDVVKLEGLGQTEIVKTENAVVVVLAGMSNKVDVVEAAEVQVITLQGASNAVEIADGIDVQRITLEGFRNVVVLPHDSKPEIIKKGVSNRILYRKK
jgi:hypothetical protein